jgi:UDP-N-acetylmuramate dehydrogenase
MNAVVDRATFDRLAPAPHYPMQNDAVKIPAAWLIEQSGFARGHVDGAVGLSTKHPLAIINRGGARARDVLRLASRIKTTVSDRFGINLRPEPVFVGFPIDDPDVAFLRS